MLKTGQEWGGGPEMGIQIPTLKGSYKDKLVDEAFDWKLAHSRAG